MSKPKADKPSPPLPAELPVEPPPILKTWKALYLLVLGQLVLMIVAFYFFTKIFE